MDIKHLTMKEKLILIGGIRLFLWEVYGIEGTLENEEKVSEIIKQEFPRPDDIKDSDIDIVLETSIELYSKLAHKVLEEKRDGIN
jgi:hypothetical protein